MVRGSGQNGCRGRFGVDIEAKADEDGAVAEWLKVIHRLTGWRSDLAGEFETRTSSLALRIAHALPDSSPTLNHFAGEPLGLGY